MHSLRFSVVHNALRTFAIVLVLFLSQDAIGQIRIQERISINPAVANRVTVGASIRVEFSWDAATANARMYLQAPCLVASDTVLYPTAGTTVSYTFADAHAGLYRVNPQLSIYPSTVVTVTTKIFLNDSLVVETVASDLGTLCGGYCPFPGASQFVYTPPAFTTFALTTSFPGIYHSRSLSLDLQGGYDCTENEWIPASDPVTLQITSGAELGEFCRLSGNCLGAAITVLASELSDIQFVADGVEPPAEGSSVMVQASSNGIVAEKTFMVYRRGPLHLSIYSPFGTDTYYGNDNILFVDCLNERGDPFPPGANVTYTFQIINGQQWGWLADPGTTNELGDITPGMPQENGRGAILFSALEDKPDVPKSVAVHVSASDPTIAPAELTLNVLPQIVPYVVVTIDPERIGVGDTANINVKRMNESGVLEDYPQDQLFDVAIRSGPQYGVLLAGGQTGEKFTEVSAGFKFIAADLIETDIVQSIITVRLPGLPTRPAGGGETKKKSVKKGEGAMFPFYFDNGGVGKVTIAGDTSGCPIVMFSPPEIAAGETTAVFIKKQKPDGTIEEYPPEQLFSAEVLGETPYGRLFSSLQPDTVVSLTGYRDDIRFVAGSQISGDSVIVPIRVEIVVARPNSPNDNNKKLFSEQKLRESPKRRGRIESPPSITTTCQPEWNLIVMSRGCEPACVNPSVLYTIPDERVDDQSICNNYYYGITDSYLDLYEPFSTDVCFSPRNRWEPYLIEVKGKSVYGLCSDTRGGRPIDINSATRQTSQSTTTKRLSTNSASRETTLLVWMIHTPPNMVPHKVSSRTSLGMFLTTEGELRKPLRVGFVGLETTAGD